MTPPSTQCLLSGDEVDSRFAEVDSNLSLAEDDRPVQHEDLSLGTSHEHDHQRSGLLRCFVAVAFPDEEEDQ